MRLEKESVWEGRRRELKRVAVVEGMRKLGFLREVEESMVLIALSRSAAALSIRF